MRRQRVGHTSGTDAEAATGSWAAAEFATLDLGDPRRAARAIDLLQTLADQPTASLPAACRDATQLEAAYRFCANASIDAPALLAAHRQATYQRLAAAPLVLAVNDTTLLDYSSHPGTLELGPLRRATQQGLLLHGTLAVTPEGVPLGVLAEEVWTRDADSYGQLPDRHSRTLEEKESVVWLHSLQAACAARRACPRTQFVAVGDREAASYDLLLAPRPAGVEVLVRARHDRTLVGGGRLRAQVAQAAVVAETTVVVRARPGSAARTAHLAVRCCAVTLTPPARRASERLPAVAVWVVWAHAPHPPQDTAPLDWLLLTTVPTEAGEAALERLGWYRQRWVIELWHKALKSGCAIEARQRKTAAGLSRLLSLYSIIAWRLLYATYLARAAPQLPCTVLLRPAEWQTLWCLTHRSRAVPAEPPCVADAVLWLARQGGYVARGKNTPPGMTTLWRGWQRLSAAVPLYLAVQP
jgi:hypothetical protein